MSRALSFVQSFFRTQQLDADIMLRVQSDEIVCVTRDRVIQMPAVFAQDRLNRRTLSIGQEAQDAFVHTPSQFNFIRPFRSDQVENLSEAKVLLSQMLQTVSEKSNGMLLPFRTLWWVIYPSGGDLQTRFLLKLGRELGALNQGFLHASRVLLENQAGVLLDMNYERLTLSLILANGSVNVWHRPFGLKDVMFEIRQVLKHQHELELGDEGMTSLCRELLFTTEGASAERVTVVRGRHPLSGQPVSQKVRVDELESVQRRISETVGLLLRSQVLPVAQALTDREQLPFFLSGAAAELQSVWNGVVDALGKVVEAKQPRRVELATKLQNLITQGGLATAEYRPELV